MREAIAAATGRPPPPVVPAPVVYDYGQTRALQWLPLLDALDVLVPDPVSSVLPPTLEDAGQGCVHRVAAGQHASLCVNCCTPQWVLPALHPRHRSGVAVYAATLPAALLAQGRQLYVGTAVRDFATIYIQQQPVARIDRTTAHDALAVNLSASDLRDASSVNLSASVDRQDVHQDVVDQRMDIVVEAMGHNTFFDASYPNRAFDSKGLVKPLALNGAAATSVLLMAIV